MRAVVVSEAHPHHLRNRSPVTQTANMLLDQLEWSDGHPETADEAMHDVADLLSELLAGLLQWLDAHVVQHAKVLRAIKGEQVDLHKRSHNDAIEASAERPGGFHVCFINALETCSSFGRMLCANTSYCIWRVQSNSTISVEKRPGPHWSLFNGTCQKKHKVLDDHLSIESRVLAK